VNKMKPSKVVIDFFSGLDGWTQGFDNSWLIISVELNDKLDFPKLRSNQVRLMYDILDPNLQNVIWSILDEYGFNEIDLILASPPCQGYSIASCGTHWTPPPIREPKTEKAKLAVKMVKRTLSLIGILSPNWFIIENPRGLLRKMPFMDGLKRKTIWLCQYDDFRAKPTDLWSNLYNKWDPRPECKNYRYDEEGNIIDKHCNHESARRGATTGTQGVKGNALRSRLPLELSREVGDLF